MMTAVTVHAPDPTEEGKITIIQRLLLDPGFTGYKKINPNKDISNNQEARVE
jgi:hypothetical protein